MDRQAVGDTSWNFGANVRRIMQGSNQDYSLKVKGEQLNRRRLSSAWKPTIW